MNPKEEIYYFQDPIRLIGLEIDLEKFATMPKCTGTFSGKNGSGCLLTAFWYALGFDVRETGGYGDYYETLKLKKATEELADYYGINYEKITTVKNSPLFYAGFIGSIIGHYDNNQETEALNLLWELIEKMPKKNQVTKEEEVVMPVSEVKV